MLKRACTRIEIRNEDIEEYEQAKTLRMQQQQRTIQNNTSTPSTTNVTPMFSAGARANLTAQQRIGYNKP